MKVMPPELFARLRQEMAASRITKLLYTSNGTHQPDKPFYNSSMGTLYANLEAGRLHEEQGQFEGGATGESQAVPTFWERTLTLVTKEDVNNSY